MANVLEDPKRRTLRSIQASGNYPGAVPSLASMLPSSDPNAFTDSAVDPSKPFIGGRRPSPLAAQPALTATAPTAVKAAPLARPLASAAYQDEVGPPAYLSPNRTPLSNAAAVAPQVTPQATPQVANSQVNGNSFDLAGQNARMAAALQPAPEAAPTLERPVVGDRRGAYAGDFDFATDAAARFAARSSDPRERAKLPGLMASIEQRDAMLRGDKEIANANATNSVNSVANLQGARAKEIGALTPSKIALSSAQAGLAGAQGTEALSRANRSQALLPSDIALSGAQANESQARSGLYGAQANAAGQDADARSMLAPGQFDLQKQGVKKGAMELKAAEELDAVRRNALSGDPKAMKAHAAYMKANAGKGDGSVTEDDIITAYVGTLKATASDPTAAKLSYPDFKAQIMGTKPSSVSKADHAAMVKQYGEAQVKQMLEKAGLKVDG